MARTPVEDAALPTQALQQPDGAPEHLAIDIHLPGLDPAQEQQQDQLARAEALEQLALYHAQCDDAASACWYLCRSLGLARQQEPGEPNLELLFELLGALADLPAEVSAAPLPEAVGEADGLGIFELCHQLASARELTQAAWTELQDDSELPACPSAAAHQLH
ncbi:hypothetical protein RQP53_15115 [Paucibacter sp. APW11]|uniref:Uncharacterized protein n=1 Tax=Roseateles aquae TaxID=3077235 RepID=A0ABU3PDJ4_9BURK|nr:hypothetical protein [Paucibacter sp. APW11]MDT9000603.1 hypothetical protein [Paucibacter sp. APW11]